ncbi:hypothetical protein ACTWQF_34515 [Streptomyces sp. 8N114]|uniref:hypothetical protein n=1 Tax=Streptomyces sp. 8N114 TaxID=3457419 RepID=UPI003FD46A83
MTARRLATILGAPLAAAALLVALPNSASAADPDHSMQTDDGDPGGKVTLIERGDVVTVTDQEEDGWAVRAFVYNPDGSLRYKVNAAGSGDHNTKQASDGGVYNLKENTTYGFKVCLVRPGDIAYCDSDSWRNNQNSSDMVP